MAFMMPVVKNEFDIYNGSRNRKTSESSSASSGRSRKTSDTKSEGFGISSVNNENTIPSHRSMPKGFSRNSSRSSQSSFSVSPTHHAPPTSPPSKSMNSKSGGHGSEGQLNKFHTRLVDKLRRSFSKDNAKRS